MSCTNGLEIETPSLNQHNRRTVASSGLELGKMSISTISVTEAASSPAVALGHGNVFTPDHMSAAMVAVSALMAVLAALTAGHAARFTRDEVDERYLLGVFDGAGYAFGSGDVF